MQSIRKLLPLCVWLGLIVRAWATTEVFNDAVGYSNGSEYHWVCPAGVTSLTIRSRGAGGNGGNYDSGSGYPFGAGGGGGGYFHVDNFPVTAAVTYYITLPQGYDGGGFFGIADVTGCATSPGGGGATKYAGAYGGGEGDTGANPGAGGGTDYSHGDLVASNTGSTGGDGNDASGGNRASDGGDGLDSGYDNGNTGVSHSAQGGMGDGGSGGDPSVIGGQYGQFGAASGGGSLGDAFWGGDGWLRLDYVAVANTGNFFQLFKNEHLPRRKHYVAKTIDLLDVRRRSVRLCSTCTAA